MRRFFQTLRFVRVMYLICKFIIVGNLYRLFKRDTTLLLQQYCRKVIHIMRIKCDFKSRIATNQNYFIVSNHMSYLDVMVICAHIPAAFITSVEVSEMPFLGWVCKAAGCVFVERRNPRKLHQEIRNIAHVLEDGTNVCLFPEATSSNGLQFIPFKRSLYKAAIQAQKDTLPLCLRYTHIDGEAFNPYNNDKVCWYGDMDFLPHFWNMMSFKEIRSELSCLDLIEYQPGLNAKDACQTSYDRISSHYFANEEQSLKNSAYNLQLG